ncbi:hypothetical protein D3A96_01685 [Robertkochia marina]|nr:hypothetical protein D3A96_01685 [Robertkochia marina]
MVTAHIDILKDQFLLDDEEKPVESTRLAIEDQGAFEFKKTTDIVLSNRFRLKNTIVHLQDHPEISYKDRVLNAARQPIYDSIAEVYFDDKILLKSNSLKQLTTSYHKDPDFWKNAGLESFEVDMIKSDANTLVCRYTFVSYNLQEYRAFEIRVDRKGETAIEQV